MTCLNTVWSCCVCAGWLESSGGLKSWMTGGSWPRSLAHRHWVWSTDCVFCRSNELYSLCVMCQELIRMLDELLIVHSAHSPSPRAPLIWIHLAFILLHYTGLHYCQVVCEMFSIAEIDSGNLILKISCSTLHLLNTKQSGKVQI